MERTQIAALVQKARAGDKAAMSSLLETAYGSVIFQCRKIMQHPEDAEDMAQEVVLTIYQNLGKLQDPEKFLGWSNRIAAHMCLNQKQRHPKDLQFLEDENGRSFLDTIEDADQQHVPDAVLDNEETKKMVVDLIDALPEAQRTAVYLYYYSEMSVREIAALTGVSENTVKSRLNYGRKALKDGFLGYEKDGVKLYSFSPLPFLLLLLRGAAESQADPAAAAAAVGSLLTSSGAATAGAGEVAGASGAAAGGAGTAAGTAAAAGGGILSAVSAKVVAAILAGAVAVGGVTAGVSTLLNGKADTPGATDGSGPLASYTMRRTTVLEQEAGLIGIVLETPLFDEVSQGYREINAYFDPIHAAFNPEENSNVAAMLSIYQGGGDAAEYIARYDVSYQDASYVSMRLRESIWPTETFPTSDRTSFTFDTRTGQLLELTDLYEGSEEEIAAQMAQLIREYGYGRYLNSDNYPTARDGFVLSSQTTGETTAYAHLAFQEGQPVYWWHLDDTVDDVCIPLPATLPEAADTEIPADEGRLPSYTAHRTELDTGRSNIQMSIETPVFDSDAEGYQAINAFWEEAHREYVEDEYYTILGQLIFRGGGYAHTSFEVTEQTEDRVVIRLIGRIKAGNDLSEPVTEYVFDAQTGELLSG